MGFAGAELSNTLTQVVDRFDLMASDPFNDVKDVDYRTSWVSFSLLRFWMNRINPIDLLRFLDGE